MTEFTANINDQVAFQLTDHGLAIWQRDRSYPPTIDEQGRCVMQLWDFARLFGPHLFCGAQQIIVGNQISVSWPRD